MEAKLRRADIVIIASAHNPSIIAPQWLKDNSLITEACYRTAGEKYHCSQFQLPS